MKAVAVGGSKLFGKIEGNFGRHATAGVLRAACSTRRRSTRFHRSGYRPDRKQPQSSNGFPYSPTPSRSRAAGATRDDDDGTARRGAQHARLTPGENCTSLVDFGLNFAGTGSAARGAVAGFRRFHFVGAKRLAAVPSRKVMEGPLRSAARLAGPVFSRRLLAGFRLDLDYVEPLDELMRVRWPWFRARRLWFRAP